MAMLDRKPSPGKLSPENSACFSSALPRLPPPPRTWHERVLTADNGRKQIVDEGNRIGPGAYSWDDAWESSTAASDGLRKPDHGRRRDPSSSSFRTRERRDLFLDGWRTVSHNSCCRRNSHGTGGDQPDMTVLTTSPNRGGASSLSVKAPHYPSPSFFDFSERLPVPDSGGPPLETPEQEERARSRRRRRRRLRSRARSSHGGVRVATSDGFATSDGSSYTSTYASTDALGSLDGAPLVPSTPASASDPPAPEIQCF